VHSICLANRAGAVSSLVGFDTCVSTRQAPIKERKISTSFAAKYANERELPKANSCKFEYFAAEGLFLAHGTALLFCCGNTHTVPVLFERMTHLHFDF